MSRMKLENVVSGVKDRPLRCLIYAPEGVGKTTFAAGAPSPIFLDVEDGSHRLSVDRFPVPESLEEVYEAIAEVEASGKYKTLVIDTLDALEAIVWAHVCKRERKQSIEAFGYGKGYVEARDEWAKLLARLQSMGQAGGVSVIMLGHAAVRTFKDPQGMDHDRYELRVHTKAAGIIKEWCDLVGFANYETVATEDTNSGRFKVADTGRRLLFFTRERGFEAKSRYTLPPKLELNWPTFSEALNKAKATTRDGLVASIKELLAALNTEKRDELAPKIQPIIEGEQDVKKLEQCIRKLKTLTKE